VACCELLLRFWSNCRAAHQGASLRRSIWRLWPQWTRYCWTRLHADVRNPQIREVDFSHGFEEDKSLQCQHLAERKSEPLAKRLMARCGRLALTLVEPDDSVIHARAPHERNPKVHHARKSLRQSGALLGACFQDNPALIDLNGAAGVGSIRAHEVGQFLEPFRIADVCKPQRTKECRRRHATNGFEKNRFLS